MGITDYASGSILFNLYTMQEPDKIRYVQAACNAQESQVCRVP